jgi:hypothetical protein
MQALLVTGHFDVATDSAAVEYRDRLLEGARFVTTVADASDQEIAVRLLRDMKEHLNGVESARKRVKEPILTAGKKVDSLAAAHCEPLQAEFDRVSSLVAGFQAIERARVAAEEEKRRQEVFRLENERREAALLAAKAASGMQTEADLAKAIAAEEAAREATAVADQVIRAPLPAVIREEGMVMRKKLDFIVEDIHAVYRARPELVKLEPNRAVILSLCTIKSVVPGLKFTEELKATVRA